MKHNFIISSSLTGCESGRQVYPQGEREGVLWAGAEDGGGEAGRGEVVHVGAAHHPLRVKERKSWIFRLHRPLQVNRDRNPPSETRFHPIKASPGSDVSMNFFGKLPVFLLLVLLAAQGKKRLRSLSGRDANTYCCLSHFYYILTQFFFHLTL